MGKLGEVLGFKGPANDDDALLAEEARLLVRLQSLTDQYAKVSAVIDKSMLQTYMMRELEKQLAAAEEELTGVQLKRQELVQAQLQESIGDVPEEPVVDQPVVNEVVLEEPVVDQPPEEEDDDVKVEKTKAEFEAVDAPFGKGIWKVNSVRMYQPPHPMEVPGSGFKFIIPGQSHVNRRIVEQKLEAGLPATPVIPVTITPKGQIFMMDKHHAFVACMAVGRPVKLGYTRDSPPGMQRPADDWRGCTWKGFEKPGMAQPGFSLTDTDSLAHEGKPTPADDWRSIVPWRKDAPGTDEGKMQVLGPVLAETGITEEELMSAVRCDPTLANKLFEIMQIDQVSIKSRPAPTEGTKTGGDWNPDENTVYLDDDQTPLELVDMLVFEAHNAIHAGEFSALQHRAHRERMSPRTFGEEKGKIESKTTIEHIEHCLARQAAGLEIAPKGLKALEKVEQWIPGYTSMSEEERKACQVELTARIIASPHGGAEAELPDRGALTTAEVYFYEHVSVTQNVKGIIAYFDAKVPKGGANRAAFFRALKTITACPNEKLTWGGKFYDMAARAAIRIFALDVPTFSDAQRTVADHEYTEAGGTWEGALDGLLAQIGV